MKEQMQKAHAALPPSTGGSSWTVKLPVTGVEKLSEAVKSEGPFGWGTSMASVEQECVLAVCKEESS